MEVVRTLFSEVYTLETWLCMADGSGTLKASLIRDDDTQSFKDFVRTTVIGLQEPITQNGHFSLSQNSYQREIVLRVIEKLIKRDGVAKNVLTLGFNVMSDDCNAQVSTGLSVEYRYPNNNVNRLHFKVWKQLLARIGDDLMMYLLERASIFILLAPTCYLQIAGTPIYNAWPYEVGKTLSVKRTEKAVSRKSKNLNEKDIHVTENIMNDGEDSNNLVVRTETGENLTEERGRNFKAVYKKPRLISRENGAEDIIDKELDTITVGTAVDKDHNIRLGRKRKASGNGAVSVNVIANECKRTRIDSECHDHRFGKVDLPTVKLHEIYVDEHLKENDSMKRAKIKFASLSTETDHQNNAAVASKHLNIHVRSLANLLKRQEYDSSLELRGGSRQKASICKADEDHDHVKYQDTKLIPEDHITNKELRDQSKITNSDVFTTDTKRCAEKSHMDAGNLLTKVRSVMTGRDLGTEARDYRKTEQEREILQKFRPYDHLIFLPRTGTMYSRNIRERIPKSATLASVDSNPVSAAPLLYQKIFCDTSVHSDNPLVVVIPPDQSSVSALNSSCKELERHTAGSARPGAVERKANNKSGNHVCRKNNTENGNEARKERYQAVLNTSYSSYELRTSSYHVSSDSMNNKRKRTEESSEYLGSKIDNETVVKAHPSFASSGSNLVKTPLKVLGMDKGKEESKSEDRTNSVVKLGARKLEMLIKRKQSILKKRQESHELLDCKSASSSDEGVNRNLSLSYSWLKNSGSSCSYSEDSKDSTVPDHLKQGSVNNSLTLTASNNSSTCTSRLIEVENNLSISNDNGHKCETDDKSMLPGNSVNESTGTADCVYETFGRKRTSEINADMVSNIVKNQHNSESQDYCIKQAFLSPSVAAQAKFETTEKEERGKMHVEIWSDVEGGDEVEAEGTEVAKVQIPVIPGLLQLLEEFSIRHRKCAYKVLLRHHCSVTWTRGDKSSAVRKHISKAAVGKLLGDHVHPRKVYLFLRACLLKTVPHQLIGSAHNRNIVLKNISKLVSVGKFEKLCLGQLMAGLKTSDLPWLQNLLCNSVKLHLMAKLVYWLFSDYILILLKTYFYMTETTFVKYRVLYYRQSVWNRLHIQGFTDLFQRKIIKPISEDQAEDSLRKGTSLGVCSLKFLPKQSSLRPIMNMGRNTNQFATKKLTINQQLTDLLHILTYLKNEKPHLVGAGKFGTDDVYKSWVPYCSHWQEMGRPQLYFVKTDIVNCYDTILQKKLYSVLEDVFNQMEEDIVVRKYASVMVVRDNLKRTFHRAVSPLSQYEPDFVCVAKEMIEKNRMHDVILIDKVLHQHETKESLLQLLHSHLFNNIIRVGLKYYLQTGGISQGSVLSTLLCSLYYAEMEREFFQISEDELLMRIVDDYLLVTPSLESATKFLDLMLKGIPEFNCHVNVEKVVTNFQYTSEKYGSVAFIADMFPWCGMIFNTKTLEVGVDYSRYSGYNIADSVTYDLCHKPGAAMKKKILFTSRPKCHRMFIDHKINSSHQICINCYQLFLLSAYKFCSYNIRLPHKQRAEDNPKFFYGIICDLSKYVYQQSKKELSPTKETTGIQFVLSQSSLEWLCLKAFYSVLYRHHSLYKGVLTHIRQGLKFLERTKVSRNIIPLQPDVLSKLDEQFKEILG